MDLVRLPELTELQTFVLAVEESSIRGAARRLRLSPAAAAKRLDNLEAVVGRKLVVRGARGLALTDDGRDFLPRARVVLDGARALLAV